MTVKPSSYFGWGVVGLNLMIQWALHHDLALYSTYTVEPEAISVDPVEAAIVAPLIEDSAFVDRLVKQASGGRLDLAWPVLNMLGNQMAPSWSHEDYVLGGRPNIGLPVFEWSDLSDQALDRARSFDILLTASSWNRDLLAARGIGHAEVALQGVDPTHFHPAPARGLWEDRFVVFSGGKLELRKGQDLVVRAFRRFAERRPDALLITAWSSFWPGLATGFDERSGIESVPFREDGSFDCWEWTRRNGIPDNQVLHLPFVPNHLMPRIMREASVALFPNRAEGATNLVAMECLACGVPTILSANTGHLDIIRDDNCFPLERQLPVELPGTDGWGESDIDEIVETLERVRSDRGGALRQAERGARSVAGLTWRRYADDIAGRLRPWLTDESLIT